MPMPSHTGAARITSGWASWISHPAARSSSTATWNAARTAGSTGRWPRSTLAATRKETRAVAAGEAGAAGEDAGGGAEAGPAGRDAGEGGEAGPAGEGGE